jgi:hypothetical protein
MTSLAGRRVRVATFVTTVVLAVVTASPSTWAASGPPQTSPQSSPQTSGLYTPAARSFNQPRPRRTAGRLATDLRDDAGIDPAPTGYETQYRAPRDASGNVRVLVTGADEAAVQRAVEANGGSVRVAVPGKVDAVVPADRLVALSDDASVTFVEKAAQYRPDAGTVTSEGVANTTANKWHTGGKQGAGANVAIVDPGGFQGYDSELGDELPSVVGKKNFCGSNPDVFDSSFTGDPHGAEVAAIVHDMAPAAGITLICAQNDVQLVAAQNYILGLNGDGNAANDIRIVNGSFGNPIAGRGDGSGGASTGDGVVRTLRQNNVLFVAAAGNEGSVHFDFVPAGPDLALQSGAQLVAWQPNNYEDGFAVPPFTTVTFLVKWDAWTGPPKDFDLLIFNSNFQFYDASQLDQTLGAPPIEGLDITNNSGSTAIFYAAMDRFSSSTNPRFDTYVMYAASELVDGNGSITLPASSPYAFAAGAACVSNNSLEPYSGRGPTIDGRIKPDITGPDGTSGQITNSSTPYGPANGNCSSGFTGTSAAAPHVAGAAALWKSAEPGFDAGLMQQTLQAIAVDAGTAGNDNQYGVGLLTMQPRAVGGPTSTSVNGQILTVVRGTDGALWELMPDGTTWKRLGGVLTSDPTLSAMPSGRVDLFARGADNALWRIQSNDSGVTWGTWLSLGGILSSGPTSVSWGQDRIDVFVRGADGALWHMPFAGSFLGWRSLGGGLSSDPEVASWTVNRLDVFVRGNDGALWHIAWLGTAWSGWEGLSGGISGGAGATSTSNGTVDVFARGNDGGLWSRQWNGSTWISWFSLGGVLASDPDAAASGSRIDVVITGTDRALWLKRRLSGVWQPWVSLGPPGF